MNERLKELALKAYNNAGQGTPEALSSFMEVYSEKFAKLIVRDIINDLGQVKWLGESNGWDLAIEAVRTDLIKQHFGVKE